MVTVRDILAKKQTQELCTINPDASVFDAIQVFAEQNLGALLVVEGDRLVGLLTERDYARKVVLVGRSSRNTRVRDIMMPDVLYVTPDATNETCMALMLKKYIRHLPVLDGRRLIGIVSMGDVVKAELGEKDFVIDELVRYITDSPMVVQEQRLSKPETPAVKRPSRPTTTSDVSTSGP